jgi:carboxymethylenebutenolidase
VRIPILAVSLFWLISAAPSLAGQSEVSVVPDRVVVPSGALSLAGLLWKPTGAGPFPAVLFNHGAGRTEPPRARDIGPAFAGQGYVFLYLFRRGYGLSATQGEFMRDALDREAKARGEEARRHLQLVLLTTDHLDDVMAGLAALRRVEGVDATRIAVAGHSFGGQLALLAAERDTSVRAVVAFAAAAQSWDRSPELRERLLEAARNGRAPIFLTHAANDFSIAPGQLLAAELAKVKRPHELKIYPAVGETPAAGHQAVYSDIMTWRADVFRFLDEHLRRR